MEAANDCHNRESVVSPGSVTWTIAESFKIIVMFCTSALLGSVLLASHGIDLSFDFF